MRRFCSTVTKGTGRRLIKLKANKPLIQKQRKTNQELDEKASQLGLDWRIIGATVIHRYPVITTDCEQWEEDMYAVQQKAEDQKREMFMDELGGTAAQFIPDKNPSEQEILDSLPFKPRSRITEADLANDRHSTDRRLQDSLYLIVKRNRADHVWQFPQGRILDSEIALRTTAERVIDRAIGRTNRWFISNAPVGHYTYAYPSNVSETRKQFGAKIFYFRAQLIAGSVKLETRLYKDYAWIARDEVKEYFDEPTAEYLYAMLPL